MKKNSAKKILIASDHAGFEMKTFLITKLEKLQIKTIDLGCDNSSQSVDYPDLAQKLGEQLSCETGILICGSGVGISIAANRFKNIRAALCHNAKYAKLSRQHNDANVLCIGARMVSQKTAWSILKAFLNSEFEGGRHEKRVAKLSK